MTLTADRRTRATTRPSRPAPTVVVPATPATASVPVVVLAREDVYRVSLGALTLGYIQVAGPIFVALHGAVYNTSVEIAQCLDLQTAVARLHATFDEF